MGHMKGVRRIMEDDSMKKGDGKYTSCGYQKRNVGRERVSQSSLRWLFKDYPSQQVGTQAGLTKEWTQARQRMSPSPALNYGSWGLCSEDGLSRADPVRALRTWQSDRRMPNSLREHWTGWKWIMSKNNNAGFSEYIQERMFQQMFQQTDAETIYNVVWVF